MDGMNLPERFLAWVQFEPMSGCWLWIGSCNPKGYGRYWDGRKTHQAHRVAYEAVKGSIPHGLVLDHLCRVHACVNPDHLEAVTNRENLLRGAGLTAINANKKSCSAGHEFAEENTWISPDGGTRKCRRCIRERAMKRYQSNPEFREQKKEASRVYHHAHKEKI